MMFDLRTAALVTLASAAALAVPDADAARKGGVHLAWVRAEGASACITQSELEREVASRLGRDPFIGEAQQWVEGVISADGDGYRVKLYERDAAGRTVGTRSLREVAEDCRELDEAVSLAVSLIIDPMQGDSASVEGSSLPVPPAAAPTAIQTREPSASPAPEAVPPERPSPSPPVVSTSPPPPPKGDSRRSDQWSAPGLALASGLYEGIFPEPAVGFEVSVLTLIHRGSGIGTRVDALYLPEQKVQAVVGVSYGMTAYAPGICARRVGAHVLVFACAALEVGSVHAVVHDPVPRDAGDRFWLAGRAQSGVRLDLPGPLWLEPRLVASIPFIRREYQVWDQGRWKVTHEYPPIVFAAALGLGVFLD